MHVLATHALLKDVMPSAYSALDGSYAAPPSHDLLLQYNLSREQLSADGIELPVARAAPTTLEACATECAPQTPLLVLVPPGTDPTDRIAALHASQPTPTDPAAPNSMTTVSLGQGQEHAALRAVIRGLSTGSWVVLANAHLSDVTLVNLERLLDAVRQRPTRRPPTAEELEEQRRAREEAEQLRLRHEEMAAQQRLEEEALLDTRDEKIRGRKSTVSAAAHRTDAGTATASGGRNVPTAEVADLLNSKDPLHRRLRALLGTDGGERAHDEDDNMTVEEVRNSKTMSDLEKRKRIKRINDKRRKKLAHIKRRLAKREERRRRGSSALGPSSASPDSCSVSSDESITESLDSVEDAIRKLTLSAAVAAAASEPAPQSPRRPDSKAPSPNAALSRSAENELIGKLLMRHHAAQAEKRAAARGGSDGEHAGRSYLLAHYLPLIPDTIHPSFRLWLLCADAFTGMPQAITEGAIKCAFVPTEEASMQHSEEEIDQLTLSADNHGANNADPKGALVDALLGAALGRFFTSVVDRATSVGTGEAHTAALRAFYSGRADSGPPPSVLAGSGLGWNKRYPFSEHDRTVAQTLLAQFTRSTLSETTAAGALLASEGRMVEMARYLIAELTVGGRITDAQDVTLLRAHFDWYVAPVMRFLHLAFTAAEGHLQGTGGIAYIASLLPPSSWKALGHAARTAPLSSLHTDWIWRAVRELVAVAEAPPGQLPELNCAVCAGRVVAAALGDGSVELSASSSSTVGNTAFPTTYTGAFFGLHSSIESTRRRALGVEMVRQLQRTLPTVLTTSGVGATSPSRDKSSIPDALGVSPEDLLLLCFYILQPLAPAPIAVTPIESVRQQEEQLCILYNLEEGMHEFPVIIDSRDPLSTSLMHEVEAYNRAAVFVQSQVHSAMSTLLGAVLKIKESNLPESPSAVDKYMRALSKAVATHQHPNSLTPTPPVSTAPVGSFQRASVSAKPSSQPTEASNLPPTVLPDVARGCLVGFACAALQQSASASGREETSDNVPNGLDQPLLASLASDGHVPASWRQTPSSPLGTAFTLSALEGLPPDASAQTVWRTASHTSWHNRPQRWLLRAFTGSQQQSEASRGTSHRLST